MFNYQIADIAVRFSVGGRAYKQSICLRRTSLAFKIVTLLLKQGLIQKFSVHQGIIRVTLKYFHRRPLIKSLDIVSRPGHRVYWNLGRLSKHFNARNFGGFYIVSTPRGLHTSNECLTTLNAGGEILYKVILN